MDLKNLGVILLSTQTYLKKVFLKIKFFLSKIDIKKQP